LVCTYTTGFVICIRLLKHIPPFSFFDIDDGKCMVMLSAGKLTNSMLGACTFDFPSGEQKKEGIGRE
jgi:hypothetical protein